MESVPTSTSGNRRDEDIALDLLKFVAATAGITKPVTASTGFTAAAAPKAEDQITTLLDLYARCLGAIKGKA